MQFFEAIKVKRFPLFKFWAACSVGPIGASHDARSYITVTEADYGVVKAFLRTGNEFKGPLISMAATPEKYGIICLRHRNVLTLPLYEGMLTQNEVQP